MRKVLLLLFVVVFITSSCSKTDGNINDIKLEISSELEFYAFYLSSVPGYPIDIKLSEIQNEDLKLLVSCDYGKWLIPLKEGINDNFQEITGPPEDTRLLWLPPVTEKIDKITITVSIIDSNTNEILLEKSKLIIYSENEFRLKD